MLVATVIAMLLSLLWSGPSYASDTSITFEESEVLADTIGECGTECTIYFNDGGLIDDFLEAARIIKRIGSRVAIAGPCYSACTIFADKARPQVCITKAAEFFFHQGRIKAKHSLALPAPSAIARLLFNRGEVRDMAFIFSFEVVGRIATLDVYNPDISEWLHRHGGLPADGWLGMMHKEALAFWPRCKSDK